MRLQPLERLPAPAVVILGLGIISCGRLGGTPPSQQAPIRETEATATPPTPPGSGTPTHQAPLALGPGVTPPVLLKRGPWKWRPSPTRHPEGTVVVEAVIDARGIVAEVRVLRKLSPDLDAAVLDQVRQSRYKPATKDGKAVAVVLPVTATFKLDR